MTTSPQPARRRALAALAALALTRGATARLPGPAESGLLFRVSRGARHAGFVFGTIHAADPRIALPAQAAQALAPMRTLALELAPVQVIEAEIEPLEQLDDGRTLPALLGPDDYAAVRDALFVGGTRVRSIERMKPWAALLKLRRAAPRDDVPSLDERLLAAARARKMNWISLESIEEQAAAFDTIPLDAQVALLRFALAHPDALDEAAEASLRAWQRGDLAALAAPPQTILRRFPDMRAAYEALTRHIVTDRTALLHHRLFMPLRSGRVFAAVGASHLGGPEGLLAMLRVDGYAVHRVG